MTENTRPHLLQIVMAFVVLAAALLVGSVAVSAADADAAPSCSNSSSWYQVCFEPLASPTCLSPYVASVDRCVATNPNVNHWLGFYWSCPPAPFLSDVQASYVTVGGYTAIAHCSYTPQPSPYLASPYLASPYLASTTTPSWR